MHPKTLCCHSLWRRIVEEASWHCTNVSLSLKVAQGWWLVAWLCKTSLKNVLQGSSQNHLGKTWTILINSIHYSCFRFKIRLKHSLRCKSTENWINHRNLWKVFCVYSGLIFQTTGLFLTLINALVVASSQCQMTMVSYSNHTTKSSSSNLDHINYILETIRLSTHSTLWSTFPLCHRFNLRGFWDKFTFHPVFLA